MSISLYTHKILWARSGGKCAICKRDLVVDPQHALDDPSIVGDEAHIVAKTETFTRGDYENMSLEERNSYSNLILLCKVDHKTIDDQPNHYTVEKLRELKVQHEQGIRALWTEEDKKRELDEGTYAAYVDIWIRLSHIFEWDNVAFGIVQADTPSVTKVWYDDTKELVVWTANRIWPGRYLSLEVSMQNFCAVVADLKSTILQHVEFDEDPDSILRTVRYYKIQVWDAERYQRILDDYNDHVQLVYGLFCELTRAANYVFDMVRAHLFQSFRLQEGILLVDRPSGADFKEIRERSEYPADRRTDALYPGLEKFKNASVRRKKRRD